jgi:hypothetical protein
MSDEALAPLSSAVSVQFDPPFFLAAGPRGEGIPPSELVERYEAERQLFDEFGE